MLTASEVLSELQLNNPISIIRIGDGESIVLNSMAGIQELDLANKAVLHRQMGYYPSFNDIKAIRDNLISAYEGCDIIGIPAHKQKTNSHWGNVYKILQANVPNHTDNLCSIDIHYDFLNAGYFDTLIDNREKLNYISCRNLDLKFMFRWHLQCVNSFIIAPEAKFTSGYTGPVHYPDQFNRVQRWMDVVKPEGQLLLVGAGVIGKIYCNWWRDRGGIAFDIGSIFDEWAGFITRGKDRGLDKVDNDSIYKL